MAKIALTVAGVVAGAVIGYFLPPAGLATWEAVIGGAMMGGSIGTSVGGLAFPAHYQGPTLNDLSVSSSANGVSIPFGYGLYRLAGNIIWCPGLVQHSKTQSAKGGPSSTTYNFTASFACAFGEGPGKIRKIWGDSKVIYDETAGGYYPTKYVPGAILGCGGLIGAFTDDLGNVIEIVILGNGPWALEVPEGATRLQAGVNLNYYAGVGGGWNIQYGYLHSAQSVMWIPGNALPWESFGTLNAAYAFGHDGGGPPIVVMADLTPGQCVVGSYGSGLVYPYEQQINSTASNTSNPNPGFNCGGDPANITGSQLGPTQYPDYQAPTIYPGDEGQMPDPTIQANEDAALTPAFRGLIYCVWEDFPLDNFGNRIPNLRALVDYGNDGVDVIVADICTRAGLDSDQIDVSRLVGQTCLGYVVGRPGTAQQALQPLAQTFFFDGRESDGVLEFIPRGQVPVTINGITWTIPETDLGLGTDKAEITLQMGQEQELPREVEVVYADPALDYQQNKQTKRRNVKTVKTKSQWIMQVPFALDANTAAQLGEKALFLAHLERKAYNWNLWKVVYQVLDPADVIQFAYQDVTYQVRIAKTSAGSGYVLAITAVSEDANQYSSSAVGGANAAFQSPGFGQASPTLLFLYDIPLLRDCDAAGGGGYYWAMGSRGSSWPGAVLYASSDDTDFSSQGNCSVPADFGNAANVLGVLGSSSPVEPFSPWAWDELNTLEVVMVNGSFASSTQAAVLAGSVNALLVGNELLQFVNAEQNTDGSWTLSHLLRGRRGTDWACGLHAVGETVLDLSGTAIVRQASPASMLNNLRYYRAVTLGTDLTALISQQFTIAGRDLMPYSPVAIGGTTDRTGNFTICWLRRTRFGGAYGAGAEALIDGMGGPVNEETERYELDVMDGATVKRTIAASTPAAVYTAAQATVDFGSVPSSITVNVYQISAAVGRGFKGTGTCPATTDATAVFPPGGGFYVN
jgi:hypothetical protein